MRYLHERHRKLLNDDGISDEIIELAELFTCTREDQIEEFGYYTGQEGIGIPYHDLELNYIGYRMRKDREDEHGKYHQKEGKDLNLYMLKIDIPKIRNPNVSAIIPEGEKKALALRAAIGLDANVCIAAYPGCYNFRSKSEGDIAEIYKKIDWHNKNTFPVPDTDFFTNRQVFNAGTELSKFLYEKGANVSIIDLRNNKVLGKTGTDDYLKEFGLSELRKRFERPFWRLSQSKIQDLNKESDSKLISEVLRGLVLEDDPIKKSDLLNEIKDKTGKKIGDLKGILEDHSKVYFKHRPHIKEQQNQVFYNEKLDSPDTVARKVHKVTHQNERIFFDPIGNQIIFHQPESNIFRYIGSPAEYSSNLGKLVDFCHVGNTKDAGVEIFKRSHIPDKIISTLISNPREYGNYREVTFFSSAPVYTGKELIKDPGFNEENKVYITADPFAEVDEALNINMILDSFAFKDDASRTNALALILSQAFFLNYFKGEHPGGISKANDRNLGKTTFVQVSSIIANGKRAEVLSLPNDPAEMEKLIATTVKSDNVVLFDNIVPKDGKSLSLPIIERMMTAHVITARMLGHNELIKRSNNVQFFFTLNEGRFSYDMIIRCLPVEFCVENAHKINSKFEIEKFCFENRQILINELASMVLRWERAGSPKVDVEFPKFPRWASVIGGILEVNGYSNFLTNYNEVMARLDSIVEAIFQWSLETKPTGGISDYLPPGGWAAKISPKNVFSEKDDTHSMATIVGSTLTRLCLKKVKFEHNGNRFYMSVMRKDGRAGGNNNLYAVESVPVPSHLDPLKKNTNAISEDDFF